MGRKALFFDVDGTLMSNHTHTIPQSALDAVAKARAAGNLVFVNSGRTWGFLGEVRNMIEVDAFLCGCGTCIVEGNEKDHRVIFRYTIPKERNMELRQNFVRFGTDVVLESHEGLFGRPEYSWIPHLAKMQKMEVEQGILDITHWDDPELKYDKFCLWTDPNTDFEGLFAFLSPDFDIIDRGNYFYECVPKGYSKVTAIEWAMKHYGIDRKDTYVFGDSSNDLPMFRFAEHAIAMEEHAGVLDPYTTFVTKKVEEDGIAWALEQPGLC